MAFTMALAGKEMLLSSQNTIIEKRTVSDIGFLCHESTVFQDRFA